MTSPWLSSLHEHPAELAGVDVERLLELHHLLGPVRQLVHHPDLGERTGVGAAGESHPGRVEAVERAHGLDVFRRRHI